MSATTDYITLTYASNILRSANISLTPGISPNMISCSIALADGVTLPKTGDFVFGYGATTITLSNCRAASGTINRSSSSKEVTFQLSDRRWKWAFPTSFISGEYNKRDADRNIIDNDYKKSAQELAILCLEAMGESGYDASALSNAEYPYFNANYEPPQLLLDDICSRYGVKICLCTDNKVRLYATGTGSDLPADPYFSYNYADAVSTIPGKITFVGGQNLRQKTVNLEGVCYSPSDDTWYDVDSASVPYRYQDGWYPDFESDTTGDTEEKKARNETVLKCYRLPSATRTEITIDGKPLLNGWQDELVNKVTVDGVKTRARSYAKGIHATTAYLEDTLAYKTSASDLVEVGFEIDKKNGLIRFNEMLFVPDGEWMRGCDLSLTTCFAAEQFVKEFTVDSGESGLGVRLVRDDVFYEYIDGTVSNQAAADTAAEKHIQEYLAGLTDEDIITKSYGGVIDIDPDGLIGQVSWSLAAQGRCETTVSSNGTHRIHNTEADKKRSRDIAKLTTKENQKVKSDIENKESPEGSPAAAPGHNTAARKYPNMRKVIPAVEIPPRSFAEISSKSSDGYAIIKPTEDSLDSSKLVITPNFKLPAGKPSFAMPANLGLLDVSYSGSAPSAGDDFGTVEDSWTGSKDNTGFKASSGGLGGVVSVSPFRKSLNGNHNIYFTALADSSNISFNSYHTFVTSVTRPLKNEVVFPENYITWKTTVTPVGYSSYDYLIIENIVNNWKYSLKAFVLEGISGTNYRCSVGINFMFESDESIAASNYAEGFADSLDTTNQFIRLYLDSDHANPRNKEKIVSLKFAPGQNSNSGEHLITLLSNAATGFSINHYFGFRKQSTTDFT